MSRAGIEALRIAINEVRSVITTLTDEEWLRQSGCASWSVRDLVAHMSSNYKKTVDPSPAPEEPINLPAERMMDLLVEPCKDWTDKQILDEYLALCDQALAVSASMQDEPLASTVIPLSDLGSYPMNQLADAYAFDHYRHLRIDLFALEGPVERRPPDSDATRLGPAIRWIMTGMPQMQVDLGQSLSTPIVLTLAGARDGSWTISPVGNFVNKGRHGGTVAAKFLDALNII